MESKSLNFLKELCNAPSPSGFEGPALELWKDYVSSAGIPLMKGDVYGSAVGSLTNGSPIILLSGHIDEVGFMVNYINDEGFIYFNSIGYVDPSIVAAKRVKIFNKKGPVYGVVGRKATHMMTEDEQAEDLKMYDMWIDIGAIDKEDALKMISVGDPIIFEAEYRELMNNCVVGRGFDDRMGAWCVAETLVRLNERGNLKATVSGLASIQEENGAYGATMSAYNISPNLAVIIDGTHGTDFPDVSKERHGDVKLGKGPVISIGSVAHPALKDFLLELAEESRIEVQTESMPKWSGTDADVISLSKGGVACANLSVPMRYMHTPAEVMSLDDLENAVNLLVSFCEKMDIWKYNELLNKEAIKR
jgi:endoglucanase